MFKIRLQYPHDGFRLIGTPLILVIQTLYRVSNEGSYGMPTCTSEEFQALRIRLLCEVKKLYNLQVLDHSPIYMRLICTKI